MSNAVRTRASQERLRITKGSSFARVSAVTGQPTTEPTSKHQANHTRPLGLIFNYIRIHKTFFDLARSVELILRDLRPWDAHTNVDTA